MPTEPHAIAKFEQAASIEYAQWDPIVSVIAYEKEYKLRLGQETYEALVAVLLPRLEIKLDGYEAILSKQKYLAGNVRPLMQELSEDGIGLMDCSLPLLCRSSHSQICSTCCMAVLSSTISSSEVWKDVPTLRGEKNAAVKLRGSLICLCRWWDDLSARPSWQAVKDGA